MKKVRLGKTGLMVSRIGFGGIPIQRLSTPEAVAVVRGVIELGVNFIDTANAYSDSEEKIGAAIKGYQRQDLIIASKSAATDKKTFTEHLDLCLKRLGTDYLDLYQLHNLSTTAGREAVFAPGGAYEGLCEAVKAGKVRFPAFSSHSLPLAMDIMKGGLFDVVQLPFNFVDNSAADEAIPLCRELDMGFIAMKPFGGGLLRDAGIAIRYLLQFEGIVPDPGIETLAEMREIVDIVNENKPFSAEDQKIVEQLIAELGDQWCHRCDYCQPCPQDIGISAALNVESLLKRMPFQQSYKLINGEMEKAASCLECGVCEKRCPYNLKIPALLKSRVEFWQKAVAENSGK